jgi:hypothetical protein
MSKRWLPSYSAISKVLLSESLLQSYFQEQLSRAAVGMQQFVKTCSNLLIVINSGRPPTLGCRDGYRNSWSHKGLLASSQLPVRGETAVRKKSWKCCLKRIKGLQNLLSTPWRQTAILVASGHGEWVFGRLQMSRGVLCALLTTGPKQAPVHICAAVNLEGPLPGNREFWEIRFLGECWQVVICLTPKEWPVFLNKKKEKRKGRKEEWREKDWRE